MKSLTLKTLWGSLLFPSLLHDRLFFAQGVKLGHHQKFLFCFCFKRWCSFRYIYKDHASKETIQLILALWNLRPGQGVGKGVEKEIRKAGIVRDSPDFVRQQDLLVGRKKMLYTLVVLPCSSQQRLRAVVIAVRVPLNNILKFLQCSFYISFFKTRNWDLFQFFQCMWTCRIRLQVTSKVVAVP